MVAASSKGRPAGDGAGARSGKPAVLFSFSGMGRRKERNWVFVAAVIGSFWVGWLVGFVMGVLR